VVGPTGSSPTSSQFYMSTSQRRACLLWKSRNCLFKMNKLLLISTIVISLFAIIDAQNKIRLNSFTEHICDETKCQEKCLTNGYDGGVCHGGDLVMFCVCGSCQSTKCMESCLNDRSNGICKQEANSKSLCNCNE